jgi:hypothetical protein
MQTEVNVLAELERYGIGFEWTGQDEVRVKCPFHDDHTPSCHVNVQKRVFKCHTAGCEKTGDVIDLLARAVNTTRAVVLVELSKRYNIDSARVVDSQVIERYHQLIWGAMPLLKELRARGVTDELVRKYRFGVITDEGRVSIPIKNEMGLYVNIRKYLPGAPGKDKMRNLKGHGKARLYPIEQMAYDEIMLCGGECKAIVAAHQLNQHGIGAVCATCGERNFDLELLKRFQGKTVYVCMDIDGPGRRANQLRCTQLFPLAKIVYDVLLPLDIVKYPKGDINDFIAQENGVLWDVIQGLEPWQPTTFSRLPQGDIEDVELVHAVHAKNVGRRVRVQAIITATAQAPYVIPKTVRVTCDKSQKECALCQVYTAGDLDTFTIDPEDESILGMVSTGKRAVGDSIRRAVGVPASCKVVNFGTTEYYSAEDVRISPRLEISSRASDRVMQPAICLGEGVELNEAYHLVGRMWPHPDTQASTLLISEYKPTQDALSTYQCHDLDGLVVFQPETWTLAGVTSRLESMYNDLEANVTRIFQRRNLHLMIDMAYHSPLLLDFDGRTVKGWVEVLIVGDSAQGKSETALNLMRHYGLGEKVECKNASVAGLLGGLQQLGNKWFVTWGVLPTHDKRLVILEELKGASQEVIAKLTDMRSSGVAEIPKIEKRRAHARTRLIALSNPRGDCTVAGYNFGIQAIHELIGGLEDVRRFDAAMIVSSLEIDAATLNRLQRERPDVPHVYVAPMCRNLILWAWTRQPDDVVFEPDATTQLMDAATRMSEAFTDTVPLVDRGSMRYKLARLAASLACRTFSTEDNQHVIIRACHVEYVERWLTETYSSPIFGYRDFTEATQIRGKLHDPEAITAQLSSLPFPSDFCKQMLHKTDIDLQDIQDWCGWDRQEATGLLSLLVRKHAMQRQGRSYRKSPPFIELLKGLLSSGKLVDRPAFLREEF